MARSDGTFPSYNKLDLDPLNPKEGWNDGCRRCIECGKSWPDVAQFSPSPCCQANAGTVSHQTPDMTWAKAVKELHVSRFERIYEKWNEGITDEQLMWTYDENTPISELEIDEGMQEIDRLISFSDERVENVGDTIS